MLCMNLLPERTPAERSSFVNSILHGASRALKPDGYFLWYDMHKMREDTALLDQVNLRLVEEEVRSDPNFSVKVFTRYGLLPSLSPMTRSKLCNGDSHTWCDCRLTDG